MKGKAAKYSALLEKLNSMQRPSEFWRPGKGESTIRILPEIGTMGYFFQESGRHYRGDKSYACRRLDSGGKEACPLCEVNQILYQAGDKKEAKNWYASPGYLMNVIVRGQEDAGPQLYAAPQTVFKAIASIIADSDYGDVTDPDEGFDIRIVKEGEGIETKYTIQAKRNPSKLGTAEQVEEWLSAAKDLAVYVAEKMPTYEDLAKQSGAALLLGLDTEDMESDEEEEQAADPAPIRREARKEEPEDLQEEDEEPVQRVSDAIASKIASPTVGRRPLKLGRR